MLVWPDMELALGLLETCVGEAPKGLPNCLHRLLLVVGAPMRTFASDERQSHGISRPKPKFRVNQLPYMIDALIGLYINGQGLENTTSKMEAYYHTWSRKRLSISPHGGPLPSMYDIVKNNRLRFIYTLYTDLCYNMA